MKEDIKNLIDSYKKGNRVFIKLEFDDDEFKNSNFENSLFEKCWFAVDFTKSNLRNTKFVNCNLTKNYKF